MSRLRTFIAVEIGKGLRARVQSLQDTLGRTGVEVKWVEQENLHVTMLFLGEVDARELPKVCRVVQECASAQPPFNMTLERVGCFPNERRPRVVWVGIGEGAAELIALHDAMEIPLQDLGYRREERRYTPHITLGRVKSDCSTTDLSASIAKRADWKGGEIMVTEIHVMSSELRPQGPIYTVLSRAKLGA